MISLSILKYKILDYCINSFLSKLKENFTPYKMPDGLYIGAKFSKIIESDALGLVSLFPLCTIKNIKTINLFGITKTEVSFYINGKINGVYYAVFLGENVKFVK